MKKRILAMLFAFCMIFNLSFAVSADGGTVVKILVEERIETNDTNSYVSNVHPDTGEKDKIIPFNNKDYYVFEVTVPETGLYTVNYRCGVNNTYPLKTEISIFNGSDYDLLLATQLKGTGGYTRVANQDIGVIELTEGTHKIKFLNAWSDGYLAYINLTLIEPLKISSVKANGSLVSEGKVPRGTDTFEIALNYDVKSETVTENTVYLMGSEKISAVASAQGNVITLNLKESLIFGENYTLYLDGVETDLYTSDLEYAITASQEDASDSGKATLSDVTASISNGVVKAEGYMVASHGLKISGREAYLYITAPDEAESDEIFSTATSVENGKFTLEYSLGESATSGVYIIGVGGEYVAASDKKSISVRFVSPETETEMVEALSKTIDADTAAAFFDTFKTELGINPAEDMKDIEDKDFVYGNLAGKAFESAGAIINAYHAEIYTALINEADDESFIADLFSDVNKRAILETDNEKYNALEEFSEDFITEVYDLDEMSDSDAMKEAIKTILDNVLASKLELSTPSLFIVDYELFEGETLEIPLDFDTTLENVTELNIKISSDLISEDNVSLDSVYDADLVVDGNDAFITFDSETKVPAINTLGTLKITDVKSGTSTISSGGDVTQNIDGFAISLDMYETESQVTVYPKKDGFTYGSSEDFYAELGLNDNSASKINDSYKVTNGITHVDIHGSKSDWIEYTVDIKNPGDYRFFAIVGVNTVNYSPKVSLTAIKEGESVDKNPVEVSLLYTGGITEFKDRFLALKTLEAGKYTIRLTCTYADLSLVGIKIVSANELGITDVKSNVFSLLKTDSFRRGTDVIEVVFNSELKTDSRFSLKDDDSELAFKTVVDGKTAYLNLNETLEYNKTYTLTVVEATDIYDSSTLKDISFTFNTLPEANDSGYAEVSDVKGKMVYEKVTVFGKVTGSVKQTIAGRKVTLYAKDGTYLASALSDENGMFEITYSISKDSTPGAHTFKVGSEYVDASDRKELVLNYVTVEQATEIIGEFKAAATEEDAESVLTKNEASLMIDLETDLAEIEDKDSFYSHFVNKEFEDISVFADFYKTAVITETVNQATDAQTVEEVFAVKENLDLLGISSDRFALLSENKDLFVNSVLEMDKVSDVDTFVEEVYSMFENALTDEYSKTSSELISKDCDIKTGYSAIVDLALAEAVTEAVKIEFVIKSSDESLIKDIQLKNVADGAISYETVSDDTLKITFIPEKPRREYDDIADMYLAPATKTGNETLKISGTVYYPIANSSELIYAEIIEKTVNIKITESKSNSSTSSGGASTREPSGTVRVPEITPVPDTPAVPSEPVVDDGPFNDLSSVEWAKESILKLHELGIISDSEDKKFNPNNSVKKEELVKMLVIALDYELTGDSELKDVDKNAWYYKYVCASQANGLVKGDDEGNFGIGTKLSRQDLCVIIARALAGDNINDLSAEKFADDNTISDYAKNSVYWLKANKMIDGVGDNMFAPKQSVTRAMAAKLIASVLNYNSGEVK